MDQCFFRRFEVLSFLLVLIDEFLLLFSTLLLVRLADAYLVLAEVLDLLSALGGHLSNTFTLSLLIDAVLFFKDALPVEVFVELITY